MFLQFECLVKEQISDWVHKGIAHNLINILLTCVLGTHVNRMTFKHVAPPGVMLERKV